MNYKKYTNNAYNLHIITTDRFKKVMVKINFKRKVRKEDITYRNLLTKVLLHSNALYPTKRDLEIECEELYNISMGATNTLSGNYIITTFNAVFLNENYTEKGMNTESLQFILDLILKPDVKHHEFTGFDLAKRLVTDELHALKEEPRSYSRIRLFEEMGKNTPLAYHSIGYMDDLEKTSSSDLYKYYESILKSDLIDIFVIGDVKEEEIKAMIEKQLTINTLKKPSDKHTLVYSKLPKKAKTIEEDFPIEQSKLCIGFKLDDLTDFERQYVMNVYTFILGGGPHSRLFENVREKNSMCYYVGCTYRAVSNIMMIEAGIEADDFKKCVALIKKELTKMSKGNFEDNDMNAAKITYINSLKDIEDSEPNILKIFESHEYLGSDLLDERARSIQNVTKQDVINFSKKMHMDTIYLLKGGSHEEN